jgi:phosphopantothenoylcysteine synthetase/decarboxylase
VIIHSAAVSDFRPEFSYKGKIDSAKQQTLKLSPLPKIIRQIRSLNPQAVLVMFKLESRISEARLFERAKIAAEKIAADLVVANLLNPYRAFIITREGRIIPAKDKVVLANRLINEICSFSR